MRIPAIRTALLALGILVSGTGVGLLSTQTATAQDSTEPAQVSFAEIEGSYAGTFICGFGEMGMTLSLKVTGSATPDMLGGVCRSGSGPCNDAQDARLAAMRSIGGVLNFFPTAGNPEAPSGAFKVRGSAEPSLGGVTEIDLQPGAWIDQPKGFGSSPMVAKILDGEMAGKPTAPGCYTLRLKKLSGI